MPRLRLAIVESPNPIDIFEDRSEAHALAASCRLMGHQATAFFVRSRREFSETICYLASANSVHAERYENLPLILHISSHGNSGCVAVGQDSISWDELVEDITPLIENPDYKGKLVLSLSSCDSGSNKLSAHISQAHRADGRTLPAYIFSIISKTVQWDDALIAWNLLYLKLSRVNLRNSIDVRQALKEVLAGTSVEFSYSRWSEEKEKYLRWPARGKLE